MMPFRAGIIAAAAFASAGILLAPAAQAATHPVQVTGDKLKSALLPASAFGSDWEFDYMLWSKGLWHLKATDRVATMSCATRCPRTPCSS